MSDMTVSAGRRPRWGLFLPPILLLLLAAAWSGFWFYAASRAETAADAWRAQEAKSGRIYDCAKRSIAGFPFRFEVQCSGASVALVSQTASKTPFTAKLDNILVVGQIYDPKLVIAEFTAPATLTDGVTQTTFVVNWSKARSSVVGLPAIPDRASIVFDDPTINRLDGSVQVPLARAKSVELHGRLAEGSPSDHPVIETVMQIAQGSIQGVHPIFAEPFQADVRAKVTGLNDFAPKPWPQRFRELQAAGGHVEIVQSRIQQGEMIAVAAGTLGLSPNGRLDGELQMTVTGLERVIPALGIDKMLEEGVPQATLDRVAPGVKSQDLNSLFGALDRAVPGLGKVIKQNANAGVAAGINSIGTESVLEGKKARSFPLKFVDGAVVLGAIKVGQIPPLY
ncbi:DUF2125 domain-containing protein [Bradyrhizobium manausense]|uniref:DUF2125 domain-containing protein n=1 Tax=Bradyrhizobium TaxID=374 RepID=UPI001BAC119A|nr:MULTISPECIES: DUF2125 domain-containing protein [Bradyrhizobium]MBR0828824.1 DUF2125 domain-containing protein [Bradyrhizobium manausense]UVO28595.1 DUF2125 domain-containing protein [Bradyrhizobium arachidis]